MLANWMLYQPSIIGTRTGTAVVCISLDVLARDGGIKEGFSILVVSRYNFLPTTLLYYILPTVPHLHVFKHWHPPEWKDLAEFWKHSLSGLAINIDAIGDLGTEN